MYTPVAIFSFSYYLPPNSNFLRNRKQEKGVIMKNFYKKSQNSSGGMQQKKSQFGRSMIEMLGVLAIIGVLSIASISGYSQAMFKHQLNQHFESFSLLLNNAITLLPNLQRDYGKGLLNGDNENISKFFADTSMLPAGMHYNPQLDAVTDVFKNQLYIKYDRYGSYKISISIGRDGDKISSRAKAICRNVLIASKANAANIRVADMRSGYDGPDGSYSSSALFGGTFSYNGRNNRLVDAGLNEFDRFCTSCNSQKYCEINLYLE